MVQLEWARPFWPRPSWPSPLSLLARGRRRGAEVLDGGVDSGERRRGEVGLWVGEMAGEVGGLDFATGERGGSLEGSVLRGVARPEGNDGEGWRPVVEVVGSWLGKVVGTRAVDGAASMERVGGWRRLVPVTPSWQKRMAARRRVARG
jgi:hypothetical protein